MRECESRVNLPMMEIAKKNNGITHAKGKPHILIIILTISDPIIPGRKITKYYNFLGFKINDPFFMISSTNVSIFT